MTRPARWSSTAPPNWNVATYTVAPPMNANHNPAGNGLVLR